jgi:hypothetical protein
MHLSKCSMQRSTCNVQRATLNMQHATLNMQRATLNMQRATLNLQRAKYNMQRATCSAQHTESARWTQVRHALVDVLSGEVRLDQSLALLRFIGGIVKDGSVS